ncbi:hypothetical protein E2C01_014369 [Portunus trituberculatus]|uniref:Uncharacterized protein n=1 Tax=Portunus trituberculatus TaxID=210409 RepID=A0A5B7DJP4_PORTR|nr:hypothetical protein [Portunus trituberculatus]
MPLLPQPVHRVTIVFALPVIEEEEEAGEELRVSRVKERRGLRGTVEPCVLWGPRGLQGNGFKSCPRSECRLGFLTQGNGFLAGGL